MHFEKADQAYTVSDFLDDHGKALKGKMNHYFAKLPNLECFPSQLLVTT